jgi:hypothetical protein
MSNIILDRRTQSAARDFLFLSTAQSPMLLTALLAAKTVPARMLFYFSFCLIKMHLNHGKLKFCLAPFPIRHHFFQQPVKVRTMIVIPHMAQLVGDDIIDAFLRGTD